LRTPARFLGMMGLSTFHALQSLYLVWVGLLLGEIRRVTSSWPMSWLGHFGYNVTLLFILHAGS
jgi:hypothetical protein